MHVQHGCLRTRVLLACLALGFSLTVGASENRMTETEAVRAAASDFVEAFNNLDWEQFEASWAEDATVFFPSGDNPQRVEGRDAIMATFLSFFETLPERREGPPYLSIKPQDLKVQMLGDSAIVTFHLGSSLRDNRRTFVFTRRDSRWLIAHLHASRLPVPTE